MNACIAPVSGAVKTYFGIETYFDVSKLCSIFVPLPEYTYKENEIPTKIKKPTTKQKQKQLPLIV